MNPRLQRAQYFVRRLHLLNPVERIRFALKRWSSRKRNARFQLEHPSFALPPEHLAFDAHGHVDWRTYKEGGEATAGHILEVIRRYGKGMPGSRILEWGCGPGRVIRHLPGQLRQVELVGTDYNPESVQWCQAAIPSVTFVRNDLCPPLAFADDSFDLVYAVSVITHLSEPSCVSWLSELARILRRGGILLLWSNGDCIAKFLLPEERRDYDAARFVERKHYQEGKKMYLSFHPPQWLHKTLLKDFEILQHYPGGFSGGEQDVWVTRCVKPSHSS